MKWNSACSFEAFEEKMRNTNNSNKSFGLWWCFSQSAWFDICVFYKPGGLDVETNRDRDRERP